MRVVRLMVAVYGTAACAAAMATAVAEVFYDGYPYYWGNTNCRATALCTVTGGQTQGFVEAELYVDNQLVKHPILEPGLIMMERMAVSAVIDSTHWPHDTNVAVRARFKDEDGVWYEAPERHVRTRNLAAVLGRYDLEVSPLDYVEQPAGSGNFTYIVGDSSWAGCPKAAQGFSEMRYNLFLGGPVTSQGWGWVTLELAIRSSNALYVNTHGGIDNGIFMQPFFRTDSDDWHYAGGTTPPVFPPNHEAEYIYGDLPNGSILDRIELLPWLVESMGSGLPPRNTGFRPPMSFVWIDGCECGVHSPPIYNTYPEAFLFPFGNLYNPPYSSENQVFASFLFSVLSERTAAVADRFFHYLKECWTVNDAREKSYIAYDPDMERSQVVPRSHQWMALYGDWFTKVHGVYTGRSGQNMMWFN